MRITVNRIATLSVAVAAACSTPADRLSAPLSPPSSPALSASPVPTSDPWIAQYEGTTGPGSMYALYMPKAWNGDVVFYAHGIVPPQAPVALPVGDSADKIRDTLGTLGYAVAYSSFSETGYDFADGLRRTEQLRGLFAAKFGKPHRSFLLGHSLGSQIVQAIAEQKQNQYAGALALCGVLGGTKLEFDYVANIRTLFDMFYPGVLPGNTMAMPPITDPYSQIVAPALTAVTLSPYGLGELVLVDQGHMDFNNPVELMQTLAYVLTYQALGVNDIVGRAHGHSPFDNSGTVYSSAFLPQIVIDSVNRFVNRYATTADAQQWLRQNYQPTGQLLIPMVTLHNERDPLVPFRHEAAYKAIVAAAGRGDMLYQRSVDQWGHCDRFPVGAVADAFGALVEWVGTGVKPSP